MSLFAVDFCHTPDPSGKVCHQRGADIPHDVCVETVFKIVFNLAMGTSRNGDRSAYDKARYAALSPEEKQAKAVAVLERREVERQADAEAAREKSEQERREAQEREAALQARRDAYALDPMAFYTDLFASKAVCNETGRQYGQSLGPIHPFLFDFLCREIPGVKRYSVLAKHWDIPNGSERWLYFRTLSSDPIIQDGPDGVVSQMFHEKPWQGMVIRLKGRLKKCVLIPRGHLKSTIGTEALTLWEICRKPAERNLIQSVNIKQARKRMAGIKIPFNQNEDFQRLYGHLKPDARDDEWWAADCFQLKAKDRRGPDPTVEVAGIGGDRTGSHFERVKLDDVVADKTTGGVDGSLTEDTKEKVRMLHGILDPGSQLLSIGTPWADNDAHSMFTRQDGPFYQDCSFLVATLIDGDPNGAVPATYGISGPGNPIWPEKFNREAIADKRRSMPIDKEYFGQFFCQFTGTTEKIFSADWITHYDGRPEDICEQEKCNVFVAVDTGGKDAVLKKGKFDPTGIMVLGQSTIDPTQFFVLDGAKERMTTEDMADAIVDTCVYWQRITEKLGTVFKAGFEKTIYTTFLEPLIKAETIRRGIEGQLDLRLLEHGNRAKEARIRILATPYSRRWIAWPKKLVKKRFGRGEPYDLTEALRAEFTAYPMVAHEELLDCNAYAFELAGAVDLPDRPGERNRGKDPGAYTRRKWREDEETGEIVSDEPGDEGPPPYCEFEGPGAYEPF